MTSSYLDFLSPEDDEIFRPPHHESHKLVAEQLLDLVGLLNSDGHPDGVDGGLDQDALFLVSGRNNRSTEQAAFYTIALGTAAGS